MILRPLSNVIWNLFLAAIPAVLALIISAGIRFQRRMGKVNWLVWSPLLVLWLLFLPNTCYLITEWRHFLIDLPKTSDFSGGGHSPIFVHEFLGMTLFYILYSGSGILCFFLGIYPLDTLFKPPWVVRPIFFFVCSLGVYLGLVDRFNSWQVLRHQQKIIDAVNLAVNNSQSFILMLCFAVFLWLSYGLFTLALDGVRLRYENIKSDLV